ncbi:type IV secretion system protein [Xenorhabdus budapestensis]|uniref:LvhB6 n=1 Tax=Xenorhabdus budapestensis TaxID=290110 RepID=A0A2D0IT20_XENBU|nr:type IV secretion system protein [Xenorhabdus budapestensis]PHM25047.1 LvhB6 [Xenorhabdus budapestensis]
MAIELHIAETLYQAVDNALSGTISTGTALLMIGVGSLFGAFWSIDRTLNVLSWYFKGFNSVLQDEIFNSIKSAFIIFSAFNVDWYMNVVVPFVNGMPTWAIQQLSNGAVGNNQVDTLINSFLNGILNYVNVTDFSITNFKTTAVAVITILVMLIGGIPFLALCVATLMTLKVSTSLFLVVGPLFIAFGLFDQTRQYFWGWVSLLGGFMLTQLIFGVAITLEINFLNSFVLTNGEVDSSLGGAFALLFYFGTFSAIASEIPNYAATVMGGSPSGVHGLKKLLMKGTGLGAATRISGAFRNRIRPA